VLRDCADCPTYKVPTNETGEDENAPLIRFHHCRKATKFSKHRDLELNAKSCPSCDMIEKITAKGKIRTRK
jgi:acetyl-CoA carboxylase beta subunit